MMVSGYALDLYCDSEKCSGEAYGKKRGEFVGQKGSRCRREARESGWKLDLKEQKCWCPECVKFNHKVKKES